MGHHHRGYQSSYSQSIRWHNHDDPPVGDTDADGRSVHTTTTAISSTYDADEPHSFNDRDYFHTSTIRALILVFALSLHAIFEGFSIGTIDDDLTLVQVWI